MLSSGGRAGRLFKFSLIGGECSWIAAEVQGEAGAAVGGNTGRECGHPWTWTDHVLFCRVLLHRTGDVLLWQLSLKRCIFAPIFGAKGGHRHDEQDHEKRLYAGDCDDHPRRKKRRGTLQAAQALPRARCGEGPLPFNGDRAGAGAPADGCTVADSGIPLSGRCRRLSRRPAGGADSGGALRHGHRRRAGHFAGAAGGGAAASGGASGPGRPGGCWPSGRRRSAAG